MSARRRHPDGSVRRRPRSDPPYLEFMRGESILSGQTCLPTLSVVEGGRRWSAAVSQGQSVEPPTASVTYERPRVHSKCLSCSVSRRLNPDQSRLCKVPTNQSNRPGGVRRLCAATLWRCLYGTKSRSHRPARRPHLVGARVQRCWRQRGRVHYGGASRDHIAEGRWRRVRGHNRTEFHEG